MNGAVTQNDFIFLESGLRAFWMQIGPQIAQAIVSEGKFGSPSKARYVSEPLLEFADEDAKRDKARGLSILPEADEVRKRRSHDFLVASDKTLGRALEKNLITIDAVGLAMSLTGLVNRRHVEILSAESPGDSESFPVLPKHAMAIDATFKLSRS